MATWGDILVELQRDEYRLPNGTPNFDKLRRKYLAELAALTGRPTIVYYTDWFGKGGNLQSSIVLEDMQGMMEVCRGLDGPNVDILLHSPGGSAEATASIVRYLRTRFDHVRVIVPLAAMSAATMWALAADAIVMGSHSQLGPIDPQMVSGPIAAPARAILRQFAKAKEECRDPAALGAWLPILQQYGPALIEQCEAAEELAKGLVREWLEKYMFSAEPDAAAKADVVAAYFADYEIHRSHSLGIDRSQARKHGVVIEDLEDDQALQDAVLSVHHCYMHTFGGGAVKIIENHLGRTFAKVQAQMILPMLGPTGPGAMPGPFPFPMPLQAGPAPDDLPEGKAEVTSS